MQAQTANPPGLRFEVARQSAGLNTLRTDIAGFAGPTQRGPVNELVRVEGWPDYITRFGGLDADRDTAFALRGYFDNGGEVAYVVRTIGGPLSRAATEWQVGKLDPVTQQWLPSAPAGGGFTAARYRIEASSPGKWANGLKIAIHYRLSDDHDQPRVDLLISPLQGSPEKLYSLSPALLVEEVAERSLLIRIEEITGNTPQQSLTAHAGPLSLTWDWDQDEEHKISSMEGGNEENAGITEYQAATDQLLAEPEVALLALPDLYTMAGTPSNRESLLAGLAVSAEHLLDRQILAAAPPSLHSSRDITSWIGGWRQTLRHQGARSIAVYHPWIDVEDPFGGIIAPLRRIVPLGHVAGLISRLDRERGAHYTPANAPIYEAVDLANHYKPTEQADLAFSGVNLLRCQAGHGLVVWGGRTLTDLNTDPENLYLAHRRLIHRLVRAIRRVAAPMVFNNNGPALWLVLVRSITTVLIQAFRAGALKGERPEQGFRVICDESNNTSIEIENGLVQCDVQVAPAVPMEFITLRIALSNDGRLELIEP